MPRETDNNDAHFGSERIFFSDGSWYFMSRELPSIGPFDSREDVEDAFTMFSQKVLKMDQDFTDIRDFDWSAIELQ